MLCCYFLAFYKGFCLNLQHEHHFRVTAIDITCVCVFVYLCLCFVSYLSLRCSFEKISVIRQLIPRSLHFISLPTLLPPNFPSSRLSFTLCLSVCLSVCVSLSLSLRYFLFLSLDLIFLRHNYFLQIIICEILSEKKTIFVNSFFSKALVGS